MALITVFPYIRPAGIIFSFNFYVRVTVRECEGIIRTLVLFDILKVAWIGSHHTFSENSNYGQESLPEA